MTDKQTDRQTRCSFNVASHRKSLIVIINISVFRPHRMYEMRPLAIDDPVGWASIRLSGGWLFGDCSPDDATMRSLLRCYSHLFLLTLQVSQWTFCVHCKSAHAGWHLTYIDHPCCFYLCIVCCVTSTWWMSQMHCRAFSGRSLKLCGMANKAIHLSYEYVIITHCAENLTKL